MKALLITFDKYPDLDAGAVRTHMFGKMLLEAGYEVHVISMGPSTMFREISESDGIKHISFRGRSQNKLSKVSYYLLFAKRLSSHLKQNNYNVIVHSQLDERSLSCIQAYGTRKKIPVIYDSVEWFSESQFSKGKRSRAYIKNNKYNTCLVKKPSSVIAISKYLEKHFNDRGLKTIRIPVVMDTSATEVIKRVNKDVITLFYAGSPGKKDYIANVVNAIDQLRVDEQKRINFIILGCTSDQLVDICGVGREVFNRVKGSLEIKGRVPREQVIEEYSRADFSVLIRPTDQRYAKAGFPTKFVESLSCATPVICNITSDLDEYTKDYCNAIILNEITPCAIAESLNRIIKMQPEELARMKLEARDTAINRFDYHHYITALTDFIDEK